MDLDEWGRLLAAGLCNEGPYTPDLTLSNEYVQVWHCGACDAVLRFSTTISIPVPWTHYKPRRKPMQVPEDFYKAFEEDAT